MADLRHATEDDRELGLYAKYHVVRRGTEEVVEDAFVLRVGRDPFAAPALRAYADACEARYPKLAADLRRWVGP